MEFFICKFLQKNFKWTYKNSKAIFIFLIIYSGILFIFARDEVEWNNFIYNFFYMNKFQSKLLPVVMGSMWFMPIYISVTLIFPAILLFIKKFKDNSIYIFLIVFLLVGIVYSQLGGNFFYISIKILFYGFFYVLGFYTSKYKISSFKELSAILVLIFGLILVCKKVFLVDKIIVQDFKFPPNIIYLLLSLILITLALYFKERIIISPKNFFAKIGEHAIFYYFAQGISSSIIYELVRKINCGWILKLLTIGTINIIQTIIIAEIIYLLYKLFNKYIAKVIVRAYEYFGL